MNKEKLYTIRKELGWTMKRTADQTGYSAGFINNMEKGREILSKAFIQAFKKAVREHTKKIIGMIK